MDVKRVCKSVRYCGLLSVAGAKNFLGFVIFLKNGDFMRKSTCRNDIVTRAISSCICRCTTFTAIIAAVPAAAPSRWWRSYMATVGLLL